MIVALFQSTSHIDVSSSSFKADPFPFYARLRAEEPIYRTTLRGGVSAVLITRYDDVLAVLKDDERFIKDRHSLSGRKREGWMPAFARAFERNMLDVDAPDHTRLRALVHKAFTPRLMEQLRGRAQQITDNLLDAAERKGSFDLVEDFALPLPIVIISDMLGVDEKDRGKFAGWSKQLVSVSSRNEGMRILPSIMAFAGYIKKLIRKRQQDPRDDLLTAMIDAREAGDKLSEEEMMGMILLLLVAGHETTANLIANGTLELLQQRDQWHMMRQQPQTMRTAIEELLRYTGPVEKATERYAKEDTEYHGVPIARGETVLAVLASANRDEAQFPNAATLDVTRDPNRHLAFGMGIHYCLGAPLARMESQIAFTSLIERMPNLRLTTAPDQLRWRRSLFLRGLEALPVKC